MVNNNNNNDSYTTNKKPNYNDNNRSAVAIFYLLRQWHSPPSRSTQHLLWLYSSMLEFQLRWRSCRYSQW